MAQVGAGVNLFGENLSGKKSLSTTILLEGSINYSRKGFTILVPAWTDDLTECISRWTSLFVAPIVAVVVVISVVNVVL